MIEKVSKGDEQGCDTRMFLIRMCRDSLYTNLDVQQKSHT